LSYTTFTYANLRVRADSVSSGDSIVVQVDVTNSGQRAGNEVVQLYVHHLGSTVERPIRDLRGYSRVRLAPGETRTVTMAFPAASLAYWDAQADRWVAEDEQIRLQVGASSSDIRLDRVIRVTP